MGVGGGRWRGHGFDHLRLNPDWSNQADADQADQRAARTDALLHYSFKDAFVPLLFF